MDEIPEQSKINSVLPEDLSKQLKVLGIFPEELSEQFSSLDLSLDEVAKKIASVGIPSLLLVAILTNFGTIPLVPTLATSLTTTVGLISDSLTGYGIEITLLTFYLERLKKESLEKLVQEIEILPITDRLKGKLKDRLTKQELSITRVKRKITIVKD